MRKLVLLRSILALISCGPSTATAQPVIPRLPTVIPHTVVDASTMEYKLLMGYEGWFTCPADGANTGWFHWFRDRDGLPSASALRVDMWPDTSELIPDPHCRTQMTYPDGATGESPREFTVSSDLFMSSK